MSLEKNITECPHCKSKDGYYYLLNLRGTQTQKFGTDVGLMQHFKMKDNHHGKCRCNSCDKIIESK